MTILIEFSRPISWLPWYIASRTGVFAVGWLGFTFGIMNKDYRTALVALMKAMAERKERLNA